MNQTIYYYQKKTDEVLTILHATKDGLSIDESKKRLKIYGENKIIEKVGFHPVMAYLSQFKDFMAILIICTAVLSFYVGDRQTGIVLFLIVFVNSLIGYFQEAKVEQIMKGLTRMITSKAKVLRGGEIKEINASQLVPGDVIYIEEGDIIPADIRVLSENTLSCNDFALTGESNPSRKHTEVIPGFVELGNRNNLCYMSSTVAIGNAYGIVIYTGMQTQIGQIAHLSNKAVADISPLQAELNHTTLQLTVGTIVLCIVLFFVARYLQFGMNEAFIFAVGIAASMVPEGLPMQIGVALALASQRLASSNAVVKKLSSVETLGEIDIICTDKTGTLTENEMTVQNIIVGGKEYSITGLGYGPDGVISIAGSPNNTIDSDYRKYFFYTGVLASNARIEQPNKEHPDCFVIGDPTEGALITLASKVNINADTLNKEYPELREFTFDSVRKRMSSIRTIDGETYVFVKGSPDSLFPICTKICDEQGERIIGSDDVDFLKGKNDEYANDAMRNLIFAYKKISDYSDHYTVENAESDLVLLGMVSMIDPPRAEVADALALSAGAGIKTIIITGDYALTAEAIAKKVHLNSDGDIITIVTGAELREITDAHLVTLFSQSNLVFSRVSPEDKLRIVTLLKKSDYIVAVTGDGVNDAPALKTANIGVAMGRTGTDVAKQSADIVLLDDSFATLVKAIGEGRLIFQNITKTVLGCLTTNAGELMCVLISLLMKGLYNVPLSISPILILSVDLIAEMVPLTALTRDPVQQGDDIMKRKPRTHEHHILNLFTIKDLIYCGLMIGVLGYGNFILRYVFHGQEFVGASETGLFYASSITLCYATIVMCQYANILSRRAGGMKSVFTPYIWTNKKLLLSFIGSLSIILIIIYNPFVSSYFGTAPLEIMDWMMAIGAGCVYLLWRERLKIIRKKQFLQNEELSLGV